MYIKNKKIVELVRTLSSDKRYYITSMEFAKILGKRHDNVIRDIRQEIKRLEEDARSVDGLFILSEYVTVQNKIHQSYNITANGLLHMTMRYGRYSYQLRYDLIELADWLKSGIMFYDNDYSCFKKY
nr:MAG TPA: regulatory protein [Caudoviricetes sp.]